jgi:hypothetical protein
VPGRETAPDLVLDHDLDHDGREPKFSPPLPSGERAGVRGAVQTASTRPQPGSLGSDATSRSRRSRSSSAARSST